MKRILALLLVGILLFMVPACSYELVDPEELGKDPNEKVMDEWQEDYRDYFVDIESDEEEEVSDPATEKPAEEAKEEKEEEKPAATEPKKEEKPATTTPQVQEPVTVEPEVQIPVIDPIIQQPTVSEPEPEPEPIPEPEPEPTPIPEPEEPLYEKPPRRGEANPDVYMNDYIGIRLRWPEGWTYYTDTSDYVLERMLSEESAIVSMYEMVALGPNNSGIQIMYQNLKKTNSEVMTVDTYLDLLYREMMEDGRFTCDRSHQQTVKLSEAEFEVLPSTVESDGQRVYANYYVKKIDCFMITMVIVGDKNTIAEIETVFY